MQLKTYQQNALEQLDRWLDALKEARKTSVDAEEFYARKKRPVPEELANHPRAAWNDLKTQGVLPAIPQNDGTPAIPEYICRIADSKEAIPHVCLKVPTGGGKTLLGVAALERLKQDTGFVLWIVPTRAIYEQTITAFRTREHPYRVMLERISGGKVKLLEKADRFTKQDVASYLCVMLLMLPATNREKGKEFLKIFRDSGGYTSFFPEQDHPTANEELWERHPDLEKSQNGEWVKQSLINTLKLIRPTVILDEAHKAYGRNDRNNREFVKSVNRLNPRFVLELSATPKIGISNILVNVSGTELKDEEMIKLPIEIHSFENSDWKNTLAQTQGKLHQLEKEANKQRRKHNRDIRPIAVVRVQRTGKGQREQGWIHSDDARDYLIRNLAVPENQIRIQTSEQKELAGEDLLSKTSEVRWIITRDALKEGWDCSFAYVLALLDNTTATTAMTQMVGRVMRQPHARRVEDNESLNRCYIYCYNKKVNKAVEGVKAGLEREGLTGLDSAVRGYEGNEAPKPVIVERRKKYRGKQIFLPQVLHKAGRKWRPIDYDRDVLSAIDWSRVSGGKAVDLNDADTMIERKITVGLQGQGDVAEDHFDGGETLSLDYFVRRLLDLIPNPWQAARVAASFLAGHRKQEHDDTTLLNNRVYLSEVLRDRVKNDIDKKAETLFRDKIGRNEIRFHLQTDKRLDYALCNSFKVYVSKRDRTLQNDRGASIQNSLFEPVYESDFNELERDCALYLEHSEAIHWWHRIAARQGHSLQGWRRQRVYPDFVVCREGDGKLLILETKGLHLQGNEDTNYKRKLLGTLEQACATALDRGVLEVKEPPAAYRMLFENTWKEEINELIPARNRRSG